MDANISSRIQSSGGSEYLLVRLKNVVEEKQMSPREMQTALDRSLPKDVVVITEGRYTTEQQLKDDAKKRTVDYHTVRIRPKNEAERQEAIEAAKAAKGNKTIIIEAPGSSCVTM